MSTRWYPLYQKGNPQLRVYLPNFFMKLVRPAEHQPPHHVKFIVSMEMTKYDVENYLQKIYNVTPAHVFLRVNQGRFYKTIRDVVNKEEDFKVAHVYLPKETEFKFPDLYPEKKEEEEKTDSEKSRSGMQVGYKKMQDRAKKRPDVPSWFSI